MAEYLLDVKTRKIVAQLEKYFDSVYPDDIRLRGIDLGCGTGGYFIRLEQIDPSLEIDGLDYSKKQIAHAKEKGVKNTLIHASMSEIVGVEEGTYDFAYAINSIHHLPSKDDQIKTFDEILRILKPGGLFFVHEINIKNPIIKFYVDYIFPRTRNIDDGSEIWLTESLVRDRNFAVEHIDYFTFVPDFTPSFLMGGMVAIDKLLSQSPLSVFGAHAMFVLRKPASQ